MPVLLFIELNSCTCYRKAKHCKNDKHGVQLRIPWVIKGDAFWGYGDAPGCYGDAPGGYTASSVYRAARAARNKNTPFLCIIAFCELKISRL